MGLQGMRERARLIGGTLLVRSELSGGTTIEVRAPIAASSPSSLTETSERTDMALDRPEEAEGLTSPDPLPAGAGTETADAKPTGMQT